VGGHEWPARFAEFLYTTAAWPRRVRWKIIARTALIRAEAAEAELPPLRIELAARGAALISARERADEIAGELQRTRDLLTEQIGALADVQREADGRKQQLEHATEQLAKATEKLAASNGRVKELSTELAERDAALAELQREAGEKKHELDQATDELARRRGELAASNGRLEDVSTELAERNAALAELQREAGETKQQLERAADELIRLCGDLATSNGRVEELNTELAGREAALAELQREAGETKQQLEQAADELFRLCGELTASNRSVEELSTELAGRDAVLAGLQREAGERMQQLEQASDELVRLRGELAASNGRAEELSTELAGRDAVLAEAQREAGERKQQLEQAADEVSRLSGELAVSNGHVEELSTELARQDEAFAELQREAGDGKQRVERAADEVVRLRGELAASNRRVEELSTELVERDNALADFERDVRELKKKLDRNDKRDSSGKKVATDPRGRGGSPRGPRPDGVKDRTRKRPTSEVVAWLKDDVWQLYIEDEFSLDNGTSPLQRAIEQLNSIRPGVYGPISEASALRELEPDGAMIFRMTGDRSAKRARKPSNGLHFIVAPAAWKFAESQSEGTLVATGECGISDYAAYYFSPDRGLPIVFERPDLPDSEIDRTEYRLDGRAVSDAEERMGPLFIGRVPDLTADAGGLERVKTVVIGHEGRGRRKWRESYSCDPQGGTRWTLPEELERQRIGWYFLRLYDSTDKLVESLTFRYVAGLTGIEVPDFSSDKPEHFTVAFMHDDKVQVRSSDDVARRTIRQTRGSGTVETAFAWRPNPQVRIARFQAWEGPRTIDIAIETDRV
jgi:septal ring factor EnvC (AmiA/AmiB activator)